MTTTVEWRPVVGYEGMYEVSNQGQVKSLPRPYPPDPLGRKTRINHGRVMVPHAGGRYVTVKLTRDGAARTKYVHHLVAAAFVGPRPAGMDVCHNNGQHQDNRAENLRYDTHSANAFDSVRHGRNHWARRSHCHKGHEYTPDNTRWRGGTRLCRACIHTQRASNKEAAPPA